MDYDWKISFIWAACIVACVAVFLVTVTRCEMKGQEALMKGQEALVKCIEATGNALECKNVVR